MDVYHTDLSTHLQRLRREDKFTDVTITPMFGNKKFQCHRVILAALSTYFETMFEAGLSESRTGEVELQTDDELCEAILSFMYTGHNVATMENAADLLEAANMMQIESLRLTCLKFLQTNLAEENCLDVMKTAHLHDSKELYMNARSLVLKCFSSVGQTPELSYLDKEQLISILKADNLNCSNERIVCEAALSWINADFENRIEYVGEILDTIASFPVSINCIEAKVSENYSKLEDSPLYLERLKHLRESGHPVVEAQIIESRDETMVLIGGSEGGANQNVMAFSFRQKKWFRLPPLPIDPGYNFAVCSDGLDMYISGGSNNKTGLLRYDGEKNKWCTYPDLQYPRQYHCMAAVHGSLYVLGGCKTTSDPPIMPVDMFSLSSKSWTNKHIDLPTPVRSASIAVQGHNVYMFGGMDKEKQSVTTAQCLYTKEHYTYRVFFKLPEEVKLQSRAVTLGNNIYLICKTGEVMKFTEKESAKQVGKIDHFPRKGFGACPFEDRILIVGGEVKLQARKDMLQFNVDNSLTVLMQETLPECLRDFGYTKLAVPQKHLKPEDEIGKD